MTSTRRTTTRLPVATHVPSRGAELAKGALAIVATSVLVVGVPVALLAAFGPPWPSSVPDSGWVTAPIDSGTVTRVVAVVVWLAWLHFVVCLVVELAADRRSRGLAPRVPGGGIGTQSLARRLVAAMVLVAGSASLTVSAASAATMHADDRQVSHTRSITRTVDQPRLEVAAAPVLGLPDADELSRATHHDIGAQRTQGQVTYYDVKPPGGRNYDTLWDIADRYLGDGLRYKEIWDLNKGVTQPDGRVLGNADLIYPGWVMRMPSDAKGVGLKVIDHAGPAPDAQAPATASATPDGPTGPTVGAGAAPTQDVEKAPGSTSDWTPVFGVGGGLALAGVALALRRRRAGLGPEALWAGRSAGGPPHDGPEPDGPPPPPTPGVALRDEAEADTATWVSHALRSWNDGGGPVPATSRVTADPSGLVVAFGRAPDRAAPTGWHTSADERVWSIDRTTAASGNGLSPVPGLVTIGRRADRSLLLLDLEAIPGIVSLGGDAVAARSVATSLAVDTATHPWADDRTVTLVGFADDLSAVGSGSLRAVSDLSRVIDSLQNVARHQRAACRRADTVSVRTARAADPSNGAWRYELVVCSGVPSTDDIVTLSDLAADQQVSLGVVVVGDLPEAAARFAVGADGSLTSGYLGVDVQAQQLSVEASRSLAGLFEQPTTSSPTDLDTVAAALASEVDLAAFTDGSARVRINVLGPLEVHVGDEPLGDSADLLTELATFLALRPDGAHANLVSAALWPRGVDPSTRDATLEQLGRRLSVDGASALRESDGIWSLDPALVATDWSIFRAALNHAGDQPPSARPSILAGVLRQVRGRPFDGVPAGRYSWLESLGTEEDIRLAVGLTAQAVAAAAASRDDSSGAREALVAGLSLNPADEQLWCAAVRLAARFGGNEDAGVVARQMYAAIAEHGSPLGASAQTDAIVDEILPGFRTRAA